MEDGEGIEIGNVVKHLDGRLRWAEVTVTLNSYDFPYIETSSVSIRLTADDLIRLRNSIQEVLRNDRSKK